VSFRAAARNLSQVKNTLNLIEPLPEKKGMIVTMANQISCRDLAALMASETLHAVFDVRERGEFNLDQISNATS